VCVCGRLHCNFANSLTTGENVPELTCSHTGADTDLFSINGVFRSDGYTVAVVLDTQDMDNYVQAALCC